MTKLVNLSQNQYLFEGSNRRCFVHPEDENLCVKVLHANSPAKTQARETAYFRSLKRRVSDWSHVTPLQNMVETNLGPGAVFSLIRDYDGQISKPLDHYLKQDDPKINRWVIDAIAGLQSYLLREAVVFRDLNGLNILLQRISPEQSLLVIVDGIGHNDFFPFVNISRGLARKKIARTWNRKMRYWFERYPAVYPHIKPIES